jgi:hypothetical protein
MPVADIVRRRAFITPIAYGMDSGFQASDIELAYTATNIARHLNKQERDVLKSLLRLERRGKVEAYRGGWRWKG